MNSPKTPQEQNNLMFAIILSLVVLMGWQYFFAAPKLREEKARQEFSKQVEAQRSGEPQGPPRRGVARPVAQPATGAPPAGRTSNRGARLARGRAEAGAARRHQDALARGFDLAEGRPHRRSRAASNIARQLDPKSAKVMLFSPAGTPDPISPSTAGWRRAGQTQKLPDRDTVWNVEQGSALTPATPVDAQLGQRPGPRVPPHHLDRRRLHVQGRRRGREQDLGPTSRCCPTRASIATASPKIAGVLHPA